MDKLEANVTSFVNPKTGKYAVLETDCNQNNGVSVDGESNEHKDTAYDYDLGLMSFTATGCESVATITQYYYGTYDAASFTARKYNSLTHSYTTIPGAVFSQVTIGGQPVLQLVYQITDNGPFDQDATVGTIKDPIGIGQLVVGAPNTGLNRQ